MVFANNVVFGKELVLVCPSSHRQPVFAVIWNSRYGSWCLKTGLVNSMAALLHEDDGYTFNYCQESGLNILKGVEGGLHVSMD